MKYIRTKDGIYERVMVVRQVCDDKEVAVIRPDKVEFEPIINQADTIEELCDEFVCDRKNKVFDIKPMLFRDYDKDDVQKFTKRLQTTNAEIYGAIWTDKGLIYVAKMNDEGELELL